MTNILKLAKEAGLRLAIDEHPALQRFADLIRADEREECARVCDDLYYKHIGPEGGEVRYGISICATAIRARGAKEQTK